MSAARDKDDRKANSSSEANSETELDSEPSSGWWDWIGSEEEEEMGRVGETGVGS